MIDEQGNQFVQCIHCMEWIVLEDATWDEQENTVCKQCSPIIYMF